MSKKQPPMCKNCLRDEAQHVPGWYCQKFQPRKGRAKVMRSVATMDDIRTLMAFAFRQAADFIERGGDAGSAAAGVRKLAERAIEGSEIGSKRAPTKPEKLEEKRGDLGICERKILAVLASRGRQSALQCALLAGYRMSGSFIGAITNLRASGYVVGPNASLLLTKEGAEKVAERQVSILPPGEVALSYWKDKLGACPGKILDVLVREYPDEVEVETLAERTEYRQSGSFAAALTDMRKLGVIEREYGKAKISPEAMAVLSI
jgi:hypothetical protein